jgi:hypothetical protein
MPNGPKKTPKTKKRAAKSTAFKRIMAGLQDAALYASGEPGHGRLHRPMTREQRLAETPDEKALRERYLAAMPGAGKSVSPEHVGGSCAPSMMVERIKEGGRVLLVTDQTGKTAMMFLSRKDADDVVASLKATDQELLAGTGALATPAATGRYTRRDIHLMLLPDGPPEPKTLEELKESIGQYMRDRHYLEQRAARSSRAKFKAVLAKIAKHSDPTVPLLPTDVIHEPGPAVGPLDEPIERPPQRPITELKTRRMLRKRRGKKR